MSQRANLLIVDDEPELGEIIREYFTSKGYAVTVAASAADARRHLADNQADLAILDINMPGEDGLSLARWLRVDKPGMGIVMLTSAAEVVDRIVVLEIGADDYVPKPFDPRELLARVASVLRRTAAAPGSAAAGASGSVSVGASANASANGLGGADAAAAEKIPFGRCVLDTGLRSLLDREGRPVPTTAKEFDLLSVFAGNPNRVLSRDQLMELSRHRDWEAFDRSIDLRIMRLRHRIEPDPEKPAVIKTVHGAGYIYVPDAQA